MDIKGNFSLYDDIGFKSATSAFYLSNSFQCDVADNKRTNLNHTVNFQASRAWTGSTNSVSPQTSALGSGQALDITPAYYTAHMWLRTS